MDDAVWERAKPAQLHSPQGDDADWPASVKLAYDREFLYVAIEARQAAGAKYSSGQGPRPRDPVAPFPPRHQLLVEYALQQIAAEHHPLCRRVTGKRVGVRLETDEQRLRGIGRPLVKERAVRRATKVVGEIGAGLAGALDLSLAPDRRGGHARLMALAAEL